MEKIPIVYIFLQGFAEKLFSRLQTCNERFEVDYLSLLPVVLLSCNWNGVSSVVFPLGAIT